jgi:hypothetical protein
MLDAFDVEPEVLQADLQEFLNELLEIGAVKRAEG